RAGLVEQLLHERASHASVIWKIVAARNASYPDRRDQHLSNGLPAAREGPFDDRPSKRGVLRLFAGLDLEHANELRIARGRGTDARDLRGEAFTQATIDEGLACDPAQIDGVAFEGLRKRPRSESTIAVCACHAEAEPRVLDLLQRGLVRACHQLGRCAESKE